MNTYKHSRIASKMDSSSGIAEMSQKSPYIYSKRLAPAKITEAYETYWRFAVERQNIFFRRLNALEAPWTLDPILLNYKFTNAYRASDRVSQYLIKNVIYRNDLPSATSEVFFRILLFKLFNKIETWELLEKKLGALTWADYKFDEYDKILSGELANGRRIYSAAYIMPPGGKAFGHPLKHQNNLMLLEFMLNTHLPQKLSGVATMQQGYELLRSYPTIGEFLAYQFITDINYSEITNFSEMEFVVPGPGAKDGLSKCFSNFGGLNEAELIRFVTDIQNEEFERLGLDFISLGERPLQLIDCQNLFCEISKYCRVAHPNIQGISGRTRIKQKFMAKKSPIDFFYPPKWNILELAAAPIPKC